MFGSVDKSIATEIDDGKEAQRWQFVEAIVSDEQAKWQMGGHLEVCQRGEAVREKVARGRVDGPLQWEGALVVR